MNVLYYTNVQLHEVNNGGNLCCRNHVQRLSEEKDLKVFAVVAQGAPCEEGTGKFLDSLGVPYRFVPYLRVHKSKSLFKKLRPSIRGIIQAPAGLWRQLSHSSTKVQEVLDQMIIEWKIDALVIDYYTSAAHVKLPRHDVKTCIIKLNREVEFYEEQMRHSKSPFYCLTHKLDVWRMGRLEKRLDNSVGKVVVIGRPDLPTSPTRSPAVCITPYLDPKPVQWSFTNSSSGFFVGNINHYPNKLAIEWMATKLAPEMAQVCPSVTLKVVGCTAEQVPAAWRHPQVQYLGGLDREGVEKLFRESDVMLCPIENDYGMKFKSAEAIVFGTPLLASIQTLLGLPYLSHQPAIDLKKPREAAVLLGDLAGNKPRLLELSAAQTRQYHAFVVTQKSIWTETLNATPLI